MQREKSHRVSIVAKSLRDTDDVRSSSIVAASTDTHLNQGEYRLVVKRGTNLFAELVETEITEWLEMRMKSIDYGKSSLQEMLYKETCRYLYGRREIVHGACENRFPSGRFASSYHLENHLPSSFDCCKSRGKARVRSTAFPPSLIHSRPPTPTDKKQSHITPPTSYKSSFILHLSPWECLHARYHPPPSTHR